MFSKFLSFDSKFGRMWCKLIQYITIFYFTHNIGPIYYTKCKANINIFPNIIIRRFGLWHCSKDETDVGVCCLKFEPIHKAPSQAINKQYLAYQIVKVTLALILVVFIIVLIIGAIFYSSRRSSRPHSWRKWLSFHF